MHTSLLINLDISRSGRFNSHLIGGWLGPTAGLNFCRSEKMSCPFEPEILQYSLLSDGILGTPHHQHYQIVLCVIVIDIIHVI